MIGTLDVHDALEAPPIMHWVTDSRGAKHTESVWVSGFTGIHYDEDRAHRFVQVQWHIYEGARSGFWEDKSGTRWDIDWWVNPYSINRT